MVDGSQGTLPMEKTHSVDAAAHAHLLTVAAREGWSPEMIGSLQKTYTLDTGTGGILVRFQQTFSGVPVYRGRITMLMERDTLALLAWSGSVAPPPVKQKSFADTTLRTGAAEKLVGLFDSSAVASLRLVKTEGDWTHFRALGLAPVSGRLRPYWHVQDGVLVAAFVAEIDHSVDAGHGTSASAFVISADGTTVFEKSDRLLTAEFGYTVYADASDFRPSQTPYGDLNPYNEAGSPAPDAIAQSSVLLEALDGGPPWLADNASETVGNNVDAFASVPPVTSSGNWDFDFFEFSFVQENGDFRADVTGPRRFDHPYDHEFAPFDWVPYPGIPAIPAAANDGNTNAKIVQAFYTANYLHDLFFVNGFTEAMGNMQQVNFTSEGLDGDSLNVQIHSSTAAGTTLDGASPALFLGPGNFGEQGKNPVFDLSIFAHEWAHVMYTRLRGYFQDYAFNQEVALNEGWADFIGLLVGMRGGTDGNHAVGHYANEGYVHRPFRGPDPLNGQYDSFYFGIRRYPYSTDTSVNPLTFKDIELGVPGPAIPAFNWNGRGPHNSEGHNVGEIWANALWSCMDELILVHGPEQGVARILASIVPAMWLEPVHPTMLEARDALLAVLGAQNEADSAACRRGFAARGMGAGAVAPARNSIELHGVVESFSDADSALSIRTIGLVEMPGHESDGDGILDVGETGALEISLLNSGFVPVVDASLTVVVAPGVIGPESPASIPSLLPGEEVRVDVPVVLLDATHRQTLAFGIAIASDTNAAIQISEQWTSEPVQYDWVSNQSFTGFDVPRSFTDWTLDHFDVARGYPTHRGCWSLKQDPSAAGFMVAAERPEAGIACALISPLINVSTEQDFVLSFDHGFDFDHEYVDSEGAQLRDGIGGGWIEISRNDGESWMDAESFVNDVYPGSFVPLLSFDLRRGFTGTSATFPSLDTESLNFGRMLAGEQIRVRFVASIGRTQYYPFRGGWRIDNVSMAGGSQVFHTIVEQDIPITPELAGAWFNPQTPGQGIMLDVESDTGQVFAAWFTFDTASPQAGGLLPGAEQRWLTTQGVRRGDVAELALYQTIGGRFNTATDVSTQQSGTLTLRFTSCNEGTIQYDLPDFALSGFIPVTRLLQRDCESSGSDTGSVTGAWWDPQTPGQGFFMDAPEDGETAFLAWFTFDADTDPSLPTTGVIPGTDQRWFTAQGTLIGGVGSLPLSRTRNGRFDSEMNSITNEAGEVTARFSECSASVDYFIAESALSGTIELERIFNPASCR